MPARNLAPALAILALACAPPPTIPSRHDPVLPPASALIAPVLPAEPTTPAETEEPGEPSPHPLRRVPDTIEQIAPPAPATRVEVAPTDEMPVLDTRATEPMPRVPGTATDPMPLIGSPTQGAVENGPIATRTENVRTMPKSSGSGLRQTHATQAPLRFTHTLRSGQTRREPPRVGSGNGAH